jgi:hypothetical protein
MNKTLRTEKALIFRFGFFCGGKLVNLIIHSDLFCD